MPFQSHNHYAVCTLKSMSMNAVLKLGSPEPTQAFIQAASLLPITLKDNLLKRHTNRDCYNELQTDCLHDKCWFYAVLQMYAHKYTDTINYRNHVVDTNALKIIAGCEFLRKLCLQQIYSEPEEQIPKEDLISMFLSLKHLRFLQVIKFLNFDDDCMELISKQCKNLAVLDINGCSKVTDEGLLHLSKLSNIVSLTVSKTAVTTTGLKYIFQSASGPKLRELKLDSCKVDCSIIYLIQTYCPNLEILNYSNTMCDTLDLDNPEVDSEVFKYLKEIRWTIKW